MALPSQHGPGPGSPLVVLGQPGPRRSDYHAAILSLDQIKALRSSNEYSEGPSVGSRRAAAPRMPPRPDKPERTHQVILVNANNNYEQRVVLGRPTGLSRSTSTGSAVSSGSSSSASSDQGLLARSPPSRTSTVHHNHWANRPVRTQPKPKASPGSPAPPPPLKPPAKGQPDSGSGSGHQFICEGCGKCKCAECTAPRTLPSSLACDRQCLCSAESALEHGTCMCLVKGVFYHCSNDDEGDSCADQPCSLSRSHCCQRFLCMGFMAALFPCLLCYPPVKGCLKVCQGCYDRLHRPGCRCKNSNTVYCKLERWSPQEKPS